MLDTLQIANDLRAAGFGEQQAGALASVQDRAAEEIVAAMKSEIAKIQKETDDVELRLNKVERAIIEIRAELKMIRFQLNLLIGLFIVLMVPMFLKIFFG